MKKIKPLAHFMLEMHNKVISNLGRVFLVSIFRSFENSLPCFLSLALLATTDDRVLASHSFGWPCTDILLFNFMNYLGIVACAQETV